MSARLATCVALTACGSEPIDDSGSPVGEDPVVPGSTPIDPACAEVGADSALAGVVVESLDACQVSAVPPYGLIGPYIDTLQLVGVGQGYREHCVGTDDGLDYDRVVQQYDMMSGQWTQTDAIFDSFGYMEWEAESERGASCLGDDDECADCCATYCCSGVPTSGMGSGRPHDLGQCMRTDEWSPS